MRTARLAAMGLALVASALLLAGCAPATIIPPGPTTEELRAIVAAENANHWKAMYPNEPQPSVQPVAYLPSTQVESARNQCLLAAGIKNIDRAFTKLDFDLSVLDQVQRRNFVCGVEYPIEISNPELRGYLSPAQLGYVFDYLTDRTAPCLKLLGFTVLPAPSREVFVDSYYLAQPWSPYSLVRGLSLDDRHGIDLRCPPPPIGPDYHA